GEPRVVEADVEVSAMVEGHGVQVIILAVRDHFGELLVAVRAKEPNLLRLRIGNVDHGERSMAGHERRPRRCGRKGPGRDAAGAVAGRAEQRQHDPYNAVSPRAVHGANLLSRVRSSRVAAVTCDLLQGGGGGIAVNRGSKTEIFNSANLRREARELTGAAGEKSCPSGGRQ